MKVDTVKYAPCEDLIQMFENAVFRYAQKPNKTNSKELDQIKKELCKRLGGNWEVMKNM